MPGDGTRKTNPTKTADANHSSSSSSESYPDFIPRMFSHGNPRATVGSMNGLKRELPWNTDREGFRQVDDEDWINQTVFQSLPESFPGKALRSDWLPRTQPGDNERVFARFVRDDRIRAAAGGILKVFLGG